MNIENELIKKLAEYLKRCEIQEIHLEQLTKADNELKSELSVYSAMLSDICQTLYGDRANGSPMMLCHIHAGWVCGPIQKPTKMTFVEWVYEKHNKALDAKNKKEITEWIEFLKSLEKIKINI